MLQNRSGVAWWRVMNAASFVLDGLWEAIEPRYCPRNRPSPKVVERSFSWLLGCGRFGVRYERRADLLQGLVNVACALICLRFLSPALEGVDPRLVYDAVAKTRCSAIGRRDILCCAPGSAVSSAPST